MYVCMYVLMVKLEDDKAINNSLYNIGFKLPLNRKKIERLPARFKTTSFVNRTDVPQLQKKKKEKNSPSFLYSF